MKLLLEITIKSKIEMHNFGTKLAKLFSLNDLITFEGDLGVGKTFDRLVKEKNQIVSKKILPISLSYDHRLIDGAEGARFCVYLGKCLGKDFAFKLAV